VLGLELSDRPDDRQPAARQVTLRHQRRSLFADGDKSGSRSSLAALALRMGECVLSVGPTSTSILHVRRGFGLGRFDPPKSGSPQRPLISKSPSDYGG
jgi:hypothetical protein